MILMEEQKYETLLDYVKRIEKSLVNMTGYTSTDVGFISEKEAIKMLGRSQTWFWRKRNEGILKFKKMGSKVFYERLSLLNLIKEA